MLSYPHSSPRGPIISGTGCGGLFVIIALFLVLLPALFAYRIAGSRLAEHTPTYRQIDPSLSALLRPGMFHKRREIPLGKNNVSSAVISSFPSGKSAFSRMRPESMSIPTIVTTR